jgi:hypothetical protein
LEDLSVYGIFYTRRTSQTTRAMRMMVPRRPPPIYMEISFQ